MIIIPSRTTKKINQNNRSKVLGDFWSSFGIDLQSNLGIIRVSPRMMVNTSGVANQGLSTAFQTYAHKIYTLADTRIFSNTATSNTLDATTAYVEDASTGAITTYSKDTGDLKTFNLCLCATAQTKLMSLGSNGTWTQRATLTTATLHKMIYFIKFNRLYFLEGNTIHSLDTSWSEATPGSSYAIDPSVANGVEVGIPYTMETDGQDIWIGTINGSQSFYGNQFSGAHVLRWDGISSQITTDYKIKARGVLAMCKDDRNIMHAIDTNGALLQFTGSGFEEIGRLPLNKELLANATDNTKYNAFVHPNGLQFTRNGTFIVAVNNLVGDNAGTIKENIASGIWEYSKDTGFVHRNSFTYTPMNSSTITDYGQNRISQIGALMETDLSSTVANGNPQLLCGATLYTDASATTNAILIDDPLNTTTKYGNFVTSWFLASGLKDNWNKFALRYRQLLNSVDRIWLKYRTTEISPIEISLTWSALTSTTSSFTTATNLTAMIGYEVEVLQGTGSGKCAHIVSVVNNAGTYTVVLDEPFVGITTGTAKARVQAWNKFLTVNDQLTESILKQLGKNSERIQVKCCMQFTGDDELFELIIINNTNQPLVS